MNGMTTIKIDFLLTVLSEIKLVHFLAKWISMKGNNIANLDADQFISLGQEQCNSEQSRGGEEAGEAGDREGCNVQTGVY